MIETTAKAKANPNGNDPIGTLLPHHLDMLEVRSAINKEVIARRGYYSITSPGKARDLGFNLHQASAVSSKYPALIIPLYQPDGTLVTYCMRPDNPRSIDDKRKKKLPDGTYPQRVFRYEMIKGAGNVLDCHPDISPFLGDPDRPAVFTEGAKKADSLISRGYIAINLNGVYGWRGKNARQGRAALASFDDIALNNRKSILLFDNDVRINDNVKGAVRRFKYYLESRGADVIPVLLPPSENGKAGIDDFFAAGYTVAELDQLIAYFELLAPDLGIGKRKWTTEQFVDLFIDWNYRFVINDCNEATEINGALLDDTKLDIVEARLMDEEIPVIHARKAITVIADANRYHPIKDYLDGLTWDNQDWIEKLSTYFEDEDNVFCTYLRRWLIGAVAKVKGDGKNQNFMLCLDGAQDIGKSYLAEWLCPLPDYFLESPLNPDDKDSRINLMSYFIWEVGELGSVTRRADREALKRFITIRKVTERLPWGRRPTQKPAVTSFIGTVNNEAGFLNDPTGNRRYAACTLTRIDWSYTDINVNQIWAQANALFESGEPYGLTADERATRDEINKKYMMEEPLDSMIGKYFEIDPRQQGNDWAMTTPAILDAMKLKPENRALTMRLANVLKDCGLKRDRNLSTISGVRGRYWRGIQFNIYVPGDEP